MLSRDHHVFSLVYIYNNHKVTAQVPCNQTKLYNEMSVQNSDTKLASLQNLNHITLTTFYPVYMHSPQQYSYIYFPELASLQTLKLHLSYNILPSVYAIPTAL